MSTITIVDPVTRIEGHMKVEVTIDKADGIQKVLDAKCSGTLFRGFETLLVGRHPWDAPAITERICGVCPVSHGMASVLALDAASKRSATPNGRILRNLVLGSNYIQSHILHFYLLAALDYVNAPGSAPWTPAWNVDMRGGLANDVVKNLPKAIEARRRAHEMGAVFGGKMPAPHTYIPGGFTAVPDEASISRFRKQLDWLITFIQDVYIPDVEVLASVYSDYSSSVSNPIGVGCGKLLAFGAFDLNAAGTSKLMKRGRVVVKSPSTVRSVDMEKITESVTYSWYADATNNRKPAAGITRPVDPATKEEAYSWLKAPRYAGLPYEAGPLARMWVSNYFRPKSPSVMDRHMARAKEALVVAKAMKDWLSELQVGEPVHDSDFGLNTLKSGSGIGLTEAPRGALGHWVDVVDGRIARYQVITPTCWNASPRDTKGILGPMEQAIVGTPVEDPNQPIEVLRVIHSFDPCLSCAVHVMRPHGKPIVLKVDGVCK